MGNSRAKERFELALDAKQVIAVLIGSVVILGGAFVLGVTFGRGQSAAAAPPAIAAPKDALARLDEPLPSREEPPPELKAHQALTDARSIDKMLPVPQVKATTVAIAPAATATPAPSSAPVATAPAPHAGDAARRPDPAGARQEIAGKRGAYAIQVGSAPRRADAERLAKQLAARHPRVVSADVPGKGRWYRVLIGSYETQDAAKRQLAALTRSGVHGIVTAVR